LPEEPLISVRGLTRSYQAGDQRITVLDAVDLDIRAGEMVAIIGPSGSGKSTLMNILGCLDRPTSGSYRIGGRDVTAMDEDERAALRREKFGFIFQRYQLLPDLDARANVEMPAVYCGVTPAARRARAERLLTRLGLGERLKNRPGQLSGGQQQRVSVARALMNGGEIILADEPTGALDSRSGAELIALLDELNAEGHTLVIVTHDPAVAARCRRTVEISDGRIVADSGADTGRATRQDETPPAARSWAGALGGRLRESFFMALRAMAAHRLRTFLTMLGIIIGIASVVSVVALGRGSQEKVLEQIASIGTDTITIRRGTGFGDRRANTILTLTPEDASALAAQPYALAAAPQVSQNGPAVYRDRSVAVSITGVGASYFDVNGYRITEGSLFDQAAVDRRDQVVVLDKEAARTLFPDGESPLGKVVLLDRVPARVIGVAESLGTAFGFNTVRVFVPYTTAGGRITGRDSIDSIAVRISDAYSMARVEALITEFLEGRHGTRDFFLMNSDTIRDTITSTSRTLTWLVSAIAIISLFVGGIGVMNIMLVSVTERTKEIGVRMAVGARRSDIVLQFLIEAVLVCLLGGALGVGLALGGGALAKPWLTEFRLSYSPAVATLAFASSSLIGIVFGLLPARAAARLDPVAALARE